MAGSRASEGNDVGSLIKPEPGEHEMSHVSVECVLACLRDSDGAAVVSSAQKGLWQALRGREYSVHI